jgi:hypothetical protein
MDLGDDDDDDNDNDDDGEFPQKKVFQRASQSVSSVFGAKNVSQLTSEILAPASSSQSQIESQSQTQCTQQEIKDRLKEAEENSMKQTMCSSAVMAVKLPDLDESGSEEEEEGGEDDDDNDDEDQTMGDVSSPPPTATATATAINMLTPPTEMPDVIDPKSPEALNLFLWKLAHNPIVLDAIASFDKTANKEDVLYLGELTRSNILVEDVAARPAPGARKGRKRDLSLEEAGAAVGAAASSSASTASEPFDKVSMGREAVYDALTSVSNWRQKLHINHMFPFVALRHPALKYPVNGRSALVFQETDSFKTIAHMIDGVKVCIVGRTIQTNMGVIRNAPPPAVKLLMNRFKEEKDSPAVAASASPSGSSQTDPFLEKLSKASFVRATRTAIDLEIMRIEFPLHQNDVWFQTGYLSAAVQNPELCSILLRTQNARFDGLIVPVSWAMEQVRDYLRREIVQRIRVLQSVGRKSSKK